MREWQIQFWSESKGKNPIEKWLDSLTEEQLRSVAKELRMLEKSGNNLKLPHSRALGKSLFELRERRFGYRMYYTFQDRYLIILLAAGDKTSQEKDIRIARERLLKI